MDFQPFPYMTWAKGKRSRKPLYDLGMSGMSPPGPDLLPLDADLLTLAEVDPYGPWALREAIAHAYEVAPEEVLLTVGGTSGANYLSAALTLRPGDQVMVEVPSYEALRLLPSAFAASAYLVERRLDDGFGLTMAQVADAWRPGTRLAIFTNPHNPSGVVLSPAFLEELGAFLETKDAFAIIDEVYRDFLRAPGPVAYRLHPRLLTTSSLTKVYGMGSLRIGWVLADRTLVDAGYQVHDLLAVLVPSIPAHIALRVFERRAVLRERAQRVLEENWPMVEAQLQSSELFDWVRPEAGLCCFVRPRVALDTQRFCADLLTATGTEVVPGEFFGAPRYLRLAFGTETPLLQAGLQYLIAQLSIHAA